MKRDLEHLKLLSLFHYIMAGLIGVTAALGLIYVVMGVALLSAPPLPPTAPGQPPPPPGAAAIPTVMGWVFLVLGVGVVVIGSVMTVLVAIAGRCLARQRRWMYCMILACLLCIDMPLGTALGIFTLIVLFRPSVKDLFAGKLRSGDPEDDQEYMTALPVVESPPGLPGDDRIYAPRQDQP